MKKNLNEEDLNSINPSQTINTTHGNGTKQLL